MKLLISVASATSYWLHHLLVLFAKLIHLSMTKASKPWYHFFFTGKKQGE